TSTTWRYLRKNACSLIAGRRPGPPGPPGANFPLASRPVMLVAACFPLPTNRPFASRTGAGRFLRSGCLFELAIDRALFSPSKRMLGGLGNMLRELLDHQTIEWLFVQNECWDNLRGRGGCESLPQRTINSH